MTTPVRSLLLRFAPTLALAGLTVGIAGAIVAYHQEVTRGFRRAAEREVAALADLNAVHLAERRQDAVRSLRALLDDPAIARALGPGLPHRDAEREALVEHLRDVAWRYGYLELSIVGPSGEALLSAMGRPLDPADAPAARRAIARRATALSDEVRGAEVHLVATLPWCPPGGACRGALQVQLDPSFLLRLVGEARLVGGVRTTLVHRGGDGMAALVELESSGYADALGYASVQRGHFAAGVAAREPAGVVEATDLDGAPVLAAVRVVPDSPWLLVTHLRANDLLLPVRRLTVAVTIVLFALLALAGAALRFLRGAQGAAREEAARHALLLAGMSDAVIAVDGERRITAWKGGAPELLGWSEEEAVGKPVLELLRIEYLSLPAETMRAQLEEHRRASVEARLYRKDGVELTAELKIVRTVDERGAPVRSIAVVRDVTARKAVEDALRASEERFAAAFSHSSLGMALVDAGGRVVESNVALQEMLGWTGTALRGGHYLDLLHPDDRAGALEGLRCTLQGEESVHRSERRFLHRQGRIIATRVHESAVPDHEGSPTAIVLVEDVTERQRAERAVKENEERLSLALEAGRGGIWDWNVATGAVWASPGMAASFPLGGPGLGAEALVAHVHADDAARVRAQLERIRSGEVTQVESEHRSVAGDGTVRWHHARARVVQSDPAGLPLRVVGVIVDMTDTKKLQSQLAFSTRMASIGTMAAGIGHEINNPLAYLLSNLACVAERLDRGAPDGGATLDADAVAALREAEDGARRIREIVKGLDLFSHGTDQPLRLAPVDVRESIGVAARLVRHHVAHRARLILDLAEVAPVLADDDQLKQVFLNVLLNAAQAIAEGHADENEVRVATSSGADGRVLVQISDTGCGIRPEDVGRIFDPFFTTRPVGEGAGLGLSISHGVVSRLGGDISVRTRVGEGTTFTIALPPTRLPRPVAAPVRAAAGRARLLVVDDEALVGKAVARALRGHEVVTHTRAREALGDVAAGARFDLVICDVMMPEMTGAEFYERVRAIDPDQAERFVFLTGGAFTDSAREFVARAGRPRIAKPFEPEELRQAVASELERVAGATA